MSTYRAELIGIVVGGVEIDPGAEDTILTFGIYRVREDGVGVYLKQQQVTVPHIDTFTAGDDPMVVIHG